MRRWHIRVRPTHDRLDGHARDVLGDIHRAGIAPVTGVRSSKIYLLEGELREDDVARIANDLLTDPVTERHEWGPGFVERHDHDPAVEIRVQPGVMNPPAQSALAAIRRLLRVAGSAGATLEEVQITRRYEIRGAQGAEDLDQIAAKVLANACIESWTIHGFGRSDALPEHFAVPPQRPFAVRRVPLRTLDDEALQKLSRQGHLFLSLTEMRAIRDHFARLDRDPTDLELETFAQTWSEHCVHKTLKSAIHYRGDGFGFNTTKRAADFNPRGHSDGRSAHPHGREEVNSRANDGTREIEVRFGNLLKETIAATTHQLARDWCLSVFVDNAGVVAFDEEYGIAFKVETHNHPSAIEPYGGAATGVGGCIRDIMGCGLGAKPIASTDVFCLAHPDFDADRLPKDVLHPRRVLKGVVSGVRDYGNRMGIPTVNGAMLFDDRYLANPLVFCGCIGLIPRNRIQKEVQAGDKIILAGGRTGRDGIHGATFSSAELTDGHTDEFAHAVQIGNAIEEKKVLDALLLARDFSDGCLFHSVTDCGAGGLSSAIGEMGAVLGATVDLELVPLKYSGLRYDEIWISEAQERMVFAVSPQNAETFLRLFAEEEVEATIIGVFTGDRVLRVRYRGETVGELDVKFLHEGLPQAVREATWRRSEQRSDEGQGAQGHEGTKGLRSDKSSDRHVANDTRTLTARTAYSTIGHRPAADGHARLLAALRDLNVASKEWVIRQYDHEVQSRSVIKPLVGPGFGPSDAAVLRPRLESPKGIAIACGICPQRAAVDPYLMAVAAVDEALRNVICVGADPRRTAVLDNFCWPKVDAPESLGALVRACKGAADAALAYGLPFISGKDSLNNEFSMSPQESRRTGLPARLAIPETLLISALGIIDDVRSCISMDLKQPSHCVVLASAPVDRVGLSEAYSLHVRVAEWISKGRVRSAHDVSDGGLVVALAEMCIASNAGLNVDLKDFESLESALDDRLTTYVLEMDETDAAASGWPILGRVEADARLRVRLQGEECIDLDVQALSEAWRSPLGRIIGSTMENPK